MTKFVDLAASNNPLDFKSLIEARLSEKVSVALESKKSEIAASLLEERDVETILFTEATKHQQRFTISHEFRDLYEPHMHGHLTPDSVVYKIPHGIRNQQHADPHGKYIQMKAAAGNPQSVPLHHLEMVPGTGDMKSLHAALEESVGHIEHGAFHQWLGKSEDEPITKADIARGLKAGGHPAKMAIFAKNFDHINESMDEYTPCQRTVAIHKPGQPLPGVNHSFSYAGNTPNTGRLRCTLCGKSQEELRVKK